MFLIKIVISSKVPQEHQVRLDIRRRGSLKSYAHERRCAKSPKVFTRSGVQSSAEGTFLISNSISLKIDFRSVGQVYVAQSEILGNEPSIVSALQMKDSPSYTHETYRLILGFINDNYIIIRINDMQVPTRINSEQKFIQESCPYFRTDLACLLQELALKKIVF